MVVEVDSGVGVEVEVCVVLVVGVEIEGDVDAVVLLADEGVDLVVVLLVEEGVDLVVVLLAEEGVDLLVVLVSVVGVDVVLMEDVGADMVVDMAEVVSSEEVDGGKVLPSKIRFVPMILVFMLCVHD